MALGMNETLPPGQGGGGTSPEEGGAPGPGGGLLTVGSPAGDPP